MFFYNFNKHFMLSLSKDFFFKYEFYNILNFIFNYFGPIPNFISLLNKNIILLNRIKIVLNQLDLSFKLN